MTIRVPLDVVGFAVAAQPDAHLHAGDLLARCKCQVDIIFQDLPKVRDR